MKNFEKYKDELLKYERKFALVDNKIVSCDLHTLCEECKFCEDDDCDKYKLKWLFEEYEDPTKKYQLALEHMMELYEDVCPFGEHRKFDKDYEVIQELIERFEDEIK